MCKLIPPWHEAIRTTTTLTPISANLYQNPLLLVPPSAPVLLGVSVVSSRVLSLQWSASAEDGGSPLTAYVVEFRDSTATMVQFQSQSFGPEALTVNLGDLAPFVSYEVRVRGQNIAGLSAPSATRISQTHPEGEAKMT